MKLLIAVCALAATALAQNATPRVSPAAVKALQIRQVQPTYPQNAKAVGIEGVVQINIVIGQDGLVQSATVLTGPQMLRDAAVKAVSQWAYKPFLLNGTPVAVTTDVNVTFSLRP